MTQPVLHLETTRSSVGRQQINQPTGTISQTNQPPTRSSAPSLNLPHETATTSSANRQPAYQPSVTTQSYPRSSISSQEASYASSVQAGLRAEAELMAHLQASYMYDSQQPSFSRSPA